MLLQTKKVIRFFEKAIGLNDELKNPIFIKVINHIDISGATLNNLKQLNEAISMYDRFLQIYPNHELACFNKVERLIQLNQFDEALLIYDRALQINPNDEEAYYDKGNLLQGIALFNLEQLNQEIIMIDFAVQNNPKSANTYFKGVALLKLKQYDEAIKIFEMALKKKKKIQTFQ